MRHDFLWVDLAAMAILECVRASIDMCLGAATNRRNFARRILEGMLCSRGVMVVAGSLSLSLCLSHSIWLNTAMTIHRKPPATPATAVPSAPAPSIRPIGVPIQGAAQQPVRTIRIPAKGTLMELLYSYRPSSSPAAAEEVRDMSVNRDGVGLVGDLLVAGAKRSD